MLSRLGLGTAQFGENGASNPRRLPQRARSRRHPRPAAAVGVGYLDTAPAYGDAEALVGRNLPRGHGLRIITEDPGIEGCHD